MNEHFTIDFADAVVIKERVGNIKIGNVSSGSPSVTVRQGSDGMLVLDFTLEKGDKGDKGDKGEKGNTGSPGYTPLKGTDYWTEAERAQMVIDVLSALPNAKGVSF